MKNITRQSSTIIGTSLVSVSALSLQARPSLAHGGHSNNKVENQDKKQTKDNQQPSPHNAKSENMPQMSSDQESLVESLKTVEEQPNLNGNETTTPVANPHATTSQSIPTSPIPVMGESLFALLVASPFLLFALKRWFYK